MGFASAAVGLLPTHVPAGILAPLLLIVLRLIQGFSIGGKWAGSVAASVEYAPEAKRSFYGSFTQLGNMIGILLSAGTLLPVSSVIGAEAFRNGGWRVPFLCSALLVVVGLVVRSGLGVTPEFEAQRPTLEARRVGVFREMIRDSWRPLAGITLLWASPAAAL